MLLELSQARRGTGQERGCIMLVRLQCKQSRDQRFQSPAWPLPTVREVPTNRAAALVGGFFCQGGEREKVRFCRVIGTVSSQSRWLAKRMSGQRHRSPVQPYRLPPARLCNQWRFDAHGRCCRSHAGSCCVAAQRFLQSLRRPRLVGRATYQSHVHMLIARARSSFSLPSWHHG